MTGTEARKPKRGDELELAIDALDERGRGVGTVQGLRVRLEGALPDERVRARVLRRRRDAVEARTLAIVEPSPDRVAARCPHARTCGGCTFQELRYERQLAELGHALARTLGPLARAHGVAVEPLLAGEPWNYRNKMDFTFASRRWIEADEPADAPDDFALGLHVPGRFDKVLDVERCDIAFAEASGMLASARVLAKEHGLAPWDVRSHTGLLRHLVLRKSWTTGEIMVNLVTNTEEPERVVPWVEALLARHPEVTTLVQNVRGGVALVAIGEREIVHAGPGTIEEELLGLRFRISANSFFQTNTPQARELVRLVRAEARVEAGDVVHDLYCGGGTFALPLAREARAVHGFELVEAAVADAERNARTNGVENARFHAGDLAALLVPSRLEESGVPRPDVCVVDPPRAGAHPDVVRALLELAPRRIVWVSCNAASGARDVAVLGSRYAITRIRPLDLFPHTPHLECVFTLVAR